LVLLLAGIADLCCSAESWAVICVVVPTEVKVKIVESGSHHLKLAWVPPAEANGVLIGYDIEYKKGLIASINS